MMRPTLPLVASLLLTVCAGACGGGNDELDSASDGDGDGDGSLGSGGNLSGAGGADVGSGGNDSSSGGEGAGTGGKATGAGGAASGTGGSITTGTGATLPTLPDIPTSAGCPALPDLGTATVHEVASDEQSDFVAALDAAEAGDVILLTVDVPDTYLKIDGYDFNPEDPVWVIASEGVQVHSLTVQYSSGINIAGFEFASVDGYTLLKIAAAQDIKVLRNSFDLSAVVGHGQSAIIASAYDEPTIENSDSIEIGCNLFENIEFDPAHSGSFIKVQYDSGLIPTNLNIHHNHFKNIAPIPAGEGFEGDSDREAIVFGDSDSQDVEAHYIVESNLFEDCDGENEIITVKTSNNTIRYNTFKNSLGSVSIRFGSSTHIYGNYFFADGENEHPYPNDTGGIRVYGSGHLIFNNYFEGLTGTGYRVPLLLDSGDTTDSSGGNGHERASNVKVLHNTLVGCTSGIGVGSDNYSTAPSNNTVANNLIVNTETSLLVVSAPLSTRYEANLGYGAELGGDFSAEQLALLESMPLADDGSWYQLDESSPARDVGSNDFASVVSTDIEGQARNAPDVGADEFSTDGASRGPLLPGDVGPGAATFP